MSGMGTSTSRTTQACLEPGVIYVLATAMTDASFWALLSDVQAVYVTPVTLTGDDSPYEDPAMTWAELSTLLADNTPALALPGY